MNSNARRQLRQIRSRARRAMRERAALRLEYNAAEPESEARKELGIRFAQAIRFTRDTENEYRILSCKTNHKRKEHRMKMTQPKLNDRTNNTNTGLSITLPRIEVKTIEVTVVGDSPLIMHAWSAKAKKGMLDKQMKVAKTAKESKDPQRDYEESIYRLPNGEPCFPAVAFKSAAVDACSHIEGVTKVEARGAMHIIGDMVKINGEHRMREDMVRIGMGTADIRYRAEFPHWSATFKVRFNSNVLSAEQVVNLFNTGGFAVGIGEWRPQRDGSFGMFHVE
jgi:hypothetical protein